MPASSGTIGGNDRALEGSGGGDDVVGLDHAVRGLDAEAGPADVPFAPSVTSTPQRIGAAIIFGVGDEIVGDLLLGERRRPDRRPETPCPGNRSCQAGPLATSESHRSERQRSAMRLRSRTRCGTPHVAQMLAHRHAGLAGADDERIDLFN